MKKFLVPVLLLCVAPLSAQTHETMATAAQADRVLIGPQFVPRCVGSAPQVLRVTTDFELPADLTVDCAEIIPPATLSASRLHDTKFKFRQLLVLQGATLDVGNNAAPIPTDRTVEFIMQNTVIDTTLDPFQWGNGLLNFGKQTRVGAVKTPFVQIEDAQAGATTIHTSASVSGWRVGDELLPNDTRQPINAITRPRREAKLTITAITGQDITLSKSLDFEHVTQKGPDGRVALRPKVANLTRNIYLHSASPDGVRGHTANIGDGASWDLTANMYRDLGRTTNDVVDDTSNDLSHIGTHPKARYTSHNHHAGHGSLGSRDVDNVYIGDGTRAKWGHVQHGTHDMLVQDNVCVGFKGSCIVTEDGYEVRNKFIHNVAMYTQPENFNTQSQTENMVANRPGVEGWGFWFHSVMNEFRDNEAYNNTGGVSFFAQQQAPGSYPSIPGGPLDTTPTAAMLRHQESVAISGLIVGANMVHGLDMWGVVTPVENLVAVNNYLINVEISQSGADQVPVYKNPLIVGQLILVPGGEDPPRVPKAFEVNAGYVPSLEILGGGYIGGNATAFPNGCCIGYLKLTDVTLQNAVDADFVPSYPRLYAEVNVKHLPLGTRPVQALLLRPDVWPGTGPINGSGAWMSPQNGNHFTAKNWQGSGQDYRFFFNQQKATALAWPSADDGLNMNNCPEAGISMLDCFTKYGLAYLAESVPVAQEIHLPGIVNGFAAAGLTTAFGPARCVITSPTPRAPAKITPGATPDASDQATIYAMNTGDPATASDICRVSVDGSANIDLKQSDFMPSGHRRFATTAIAPGTHTIRTWRTLAAATIPSSLMTFQYCVGPCSAPAQVTVPNVVGKLEAAARTDLTAVGLVAALAAPVANAAPVGTVVTEAPAASSLVAPGSTVTLTLSSGPAQTPPAAPVITSVLVAGDTNVSGTGITGAAVKVSVNGTQVATATVGASAWTATVPALIAGQSVTATQTVGTLTSAASTPVIVKSTVPATGPLPPGTYKITICDVSTPPKCSAFTVVQP